MNCERPAVFTFAGICVAMMLSVTYETVEEPLDQISIADIAAYDAQWSV